MASDGPAVSTQPKAPQSDQTFGAKQSPQSKPASGNSQPQAQGPQANRQNNSIEQDMVSIDNDPSLDDSMKRRAKAKAFMSFYGNSGASQ
jgi:hypothetical protein